MRGPQLTKHFFYREKPTGVAWLAVRHLSSQCT